MRPKTGFGMQRLLPPMVAAAWLATLGAAAPSPQPSPIPEPSPSASAAQSPVPQGSSQATPLPTPTPSASPSPLATPTILMLPPDAPPQILWIRVNPDAPRAGDTLSWLVLTSSNVASVEVRVGGFGVSMPKTDVGRFEGSYVVPRLPFFMSHRFDAQIIARNTGGVAVEKTLPLQIR